MGADSTPGEGIRCNNYTKSACADWRLPAGGRLWCAWSAASGTAGAVVAPLGRGAAGAGLLAVLARGLMRASWCGRLRLGLAKGGSAAPIVSDAVATPSAGAARTRRRRRRLHE